jgi:hypothetical protein
MIVSLCREWADRMPGDDTTDEGVRTPVSVDECEAFHSGTVSSGTHTTEADIDEVLYGDSASNE